MNIIVGDIVETIDDSLTGKVIRIKHNILIIETNDGFEIEAGLNEVIKIEKNNEIKVNNIDVFNAMSDKKINERKRKISVKREKTIPPMEVDLHIGQLTNSNKGMTNYEMLTLQIETAKR